MIKRFLRWQESFKSWLVASAQSPHAVWVLGIISFIESIIFPIPADVVLVPMAAFRPKKWWWFAFVATATSVLGGIAGYLIGLGLFDVVGQPLVDFYHLQDEMIRVSQWFDKTTFGAIFIGAFTPIPFKVFTLTAGFFKVNFITFFIASVLGRGLRYVMVAWLMKRFGERIAKTMYRYLSIFTLLLVVIVVIWIFFV